MSATSLFCAARSGALNQASTSASILSSVGQPNPRLITAGADQIVDSRREEIRRRGPGVENAPAVLFYRLFGGAAGNQGAPVVGLQFDIEPGLAQSVQCDQGLAVHDRLVGGRKEDDLLALVTRLLNQLLRLGWVRSFQESLGTGIGLERGAAAEQRRARFPIFRVARRRTHVVLLV